MLSVAVMYSHGEVELFNIITLNKFTSWQLLVEKIKQSIRSLESLNQSQMRTDQLKRHPFRLFIHH